uniref:response regulator transcription factor n=1 Tax=Rugosimonospora africana TaxID=556532 RepID=UPI0023B2E80B|nr:response regulator transcription factor [Rugosimonospora africana]
MSVLLADDQTMFRTAVRRLLEWEGDIRVAAEVAEGDQILPVALRVRPSVAIIDIEMPGLDGLTAAAQLHQQLPECRILMSTTFGRPGFLERALSNGATGFVLKDASVDVLAAAVRRCATGARVIDPGLAAQAHRLGPSPLTSGERQVLAAVGTGASIREIARELHLSEGTVRNRISSAIDKTAARNRIDAIRIASENGWL